MKIETERLLIRPWEPGDLKHYKAMSQDVGYNCFSLPGSFFIKDDQDGSEKIKKLMSLFADHKIGKFPVFEKQSGSFVGTCGGDLFDFYGSQQVEISYRIMLAHWSKGYATEASRAAVKYLLVDAGVKPLYGFALYQNAQSRKILEKIGFRATGEFMWCNLLHQMFVIDPPTPSLPA